MEAANAYLPEWMAQEHNRRFTVKAAQVETAFVPYFGSDLDTIWSHQEDRTVANDNTVSYHTLRLQVPQQTFRFSLARCRVLVCEHLDHTLSLRYGPHVLARYDAHGHLLNIDTTQKQRPQNKGRKKNPKRKPAAA